MQKNCPKQKLIRGGSTAMQTIPFPGGESREKKLKKRRDEANHKHKRIDGDRHSV